MALHLGPLTIPWVGRDSRKDDPYWDSFINGPVYDSRNLLSEAINTTTGGAVNPVRADIHSPEITAGHIKELAAFLGAEQCGIVELKDQIGEEGEVYPFGIVCTVKAEHDPRTAKGAGGQVPVQNGQFVSFILAAYIREMGYRAITVPNGNSERLTVEAGLGRIGENGRLVVPRLGARVHVADVVHTDLPLVPDRV